MRVMKRWHRMPREVVTGNVQGQVGQGSEQPGLVEDVPAHCRGLDYMTFKSPFQLQLFYDLE